MLKSERKLSEKESRKEKTTHNTMKKFQVTKKQDSDDDLQWSSDDEYVEKKLVFAKTITAKDLSQQKSAHSHVIPFGKYKGK